LNSLIIVLILLTLCFCLIILLPWYNKNHRLQVNQSRQSELYQGKLSELKDDLAAGNIDEQAYQVALDDLKLQLASELAREDSKSTIKVKRGYLFALPVITLIIAFSIYFSQGKVEQMTHFYQAKERTADYAKKLLAGDDSFSQQELESFYLGFRNKLSQQPDDATGWLLLGRIAYSQGYLENAMQAFEKALELEPNKYSAQMSYAQVLIAANDESYLKKALSVYQQILKQSAKDEEALVMAGYVAHQLKDKAAAKTYWRAALAELDKNDARVQAIAQTMPELAQEFNIQSTSTMATERHQQATGKRILVDIELSEETQKQLSEFQYLVVFARPQLAGPPAAVVRLPINSGLPAQVELTDQNAMMADFNISSLEQAYVTLRLSKDENVMLAEGELETHSEALSLSDTITRIQLTL